MRRSSIVAASVGVAFVLLFVVVAFVRLSHPFEVTWLESAMQAMLARRLEHESMYVAPSLGYMPCLYPPLLFDVAAVIARPFGAAAFWPLRLVSFAATLATLALVVALLRRKGRAWPVAIAWASVFVACYGRFEGWHDSSRVDSLMTFLLLAAAALAIEGRGWRSAIGAGVCGAGAVLTKQPAAAWLGVTLVGLAITRGQIGRSALIAAIATVAGAGYLAATGELANPWLRYWLFAVPASHALRAGFVVRGVTFLLATLPVAGALASVALVVRVRHRADERGVRNVPPWSLAFASWTLVAIALRCKEGASLNFFLPVVPVALIAAGESLRVCERRGRPVRATVVASACLAQLLLLAYDPRPLLPTRIDARAAAALVDRLRAVDGPVFVAAFPSYAAAADKPWLVHESALVDTRATLPASTQELPRAVEQRRFAAVLLDPDEPLVDAPIVASGYDATPLSLPDTPFLRRLHGRHLAPVLWVRRRAP